MSPAEAVARARALLGDPAAAAAAVLEETARLAAVPAPTGAERARAELVAEALPGSVRDRAGNVLARLGPADGPPLLVAAHLDTVFAADVPHAVTRDGGRMAGPGVGDNTLAVAALLAFARLLAAEPLPGPVIAAFTVGEEGRGDLRGARAAVEGTAPHAMLALEGHFADRLSATAVGSVRIHARFTGPGGHSWGDRGAPSAAHALLAAGAEIAAIPRSDLASVSVGVLAGGTSVNVLAADAHMEIDLRATDPGELAALEEATRAALARAAGAEGVSVTTTDIGRRPAGALAPDHPLISTLRAVRAEAGLPPADEEGVSTDANAALGRGIPAATLGLTRGGGMHTTGEWIAEGPVASGLVATLASVLALAGPPGG